MATQNVFKDKKDTFQDANWKVFNVFFCSKSSLIKTIIFVVIKLLFELLPFLFHRLLIDWTCVYRYSFYTRLEIAAMSFSFCFFSSLNINTPLWRWNMLTTEELPLIYTHTLFSIAILNGVSKKNVSNLNYIVYRTGYYFLFIYWYFKWVRHFSYIE